ncbi:MAG: TSUP family transporter [Acidimicrobiales bacterium]|nr:TSUP family transporter [Acidimicrobiales bacterium]
MSVTNVLLLLGGGLFAGVINTMAGGGSMLTVPLLVMAGVPGNIANGSNRVGILASTAAAATAFRRLGVEGLSRVTPVLLPVVAGALLGSFSVSLLSDELFEKIFGILMVPLLLLALRPPRAALGSWSLPATVLVFFGIGLYGGAFQVGIGLLLVLALSRSGMELVLANNVKVLVAMAINVTALPVFILNGKIAWGPALVLAAGFAVGGALGARFTVTGGEKVIRPVLALAVLALSGRLLGLY